MTPGFFDIIFRASKSEPKAPQPKKAKKAKKVKKAKKEHEAPKSLKEENAWLLSEVNRLTPEPEPEPEPEIVTEEPDDDESS